MPVAHTCNPSYLGGRDQEYQGLKPAGQTVLETLYCKHPSQKRAGATKRKDRQMGLHEIKKLLHNKRNGL
jgi:hypothetical protein